MSMKKQAQAAAVLSSSAAPSAVAIALYQSGRAVVREQRSLQLGGGANRISLAGMPTELEPSTIIVLGSSGEAKITVGDLTYSAANMDRRSLLRASRGKRVTVGAAADAKDKAISGTLVAVVDDQLLIKQANSGRLVLVTAGGADRQTVLDDGVPFGLSDTASLTMSVTAENSGDQDLSLLYETEGLSWDARHSAFYDEEAGKLTAFRTAVAISNRSGARFENAKLHLIAGDNEGGRRSRIVAQSAPPRGGMRAFAAAAHFESADGGGSVESVGDSTVYSLDKPSTLGNEQMQVIELFAATDVPVTRQYFLPVGNYAEAADEEGAKLGVYTRLRLNNTEADRMGRPLPAGTVSIFQNDAAGNPQKTGTASTGHVAAGEKFKIEFGPGNEIKALRKLVAARDYQAAPAAAEGGEGRAYPQGSAEMPGAGNRSAARRAAVAQPGGQPDQVWYREEERELTVFNYKDKPVEVKVTDYIPDNAEWLKEPEAHSFTADGPRARTATIRVEPGKQVTLQYHLRWQR